MTKLQEQKRDYMRRVSVERRREWNRKWAREHPERKKFLQRRWHTQLKIDVLTNYGGKCHCCGEKRIEFLCLDHTKNDGSKHRRELEKLFPNLGAMLGDKFYRYLRNQGYPKNLGIKTVCYNCNCARQYYGYCPHHRPVDKSSK